MWPFKRKRPNIYLFTMYVGGREEIDIVPVERQADGTWIHRHTSFSVFRLLAGGKIHGQADRRWEALDDIPGLTDDEVTPEKLALRLAEEIDDLKTELKSVIRAAQIYKAAKSGSNLVAADNRLSTAIYSAQSALSARFGYSETDQ
jgi:hypothetical protein